MKKIIAFVLIALICLSLYSCSNTDISNDVSNGISNVEDTSKTKPESSPPLKQAAQLGKTVSTDIVDFTLEHSKLTYYVSNKYSNLFEATDEANSVFDTKKGTCFVSMTITISNKDRGGQLDFCYLSQWDPTEWTVTYNNKEYKLYGYDSNDTTASYFNLYYSAKVYKDTGKVIEHIDTGSILIYAGETITLRFFGVIKVDPESLNDGFELNIKIPNSKEKYEEFKYEIPSIA